MQNITKLNTDAEALHVPTKRKAVDQHSDVDKKCFKGNICLFLTLKQEAPLTLRGQRGRSVILKGNPKYMGDFLTQNHAHFFSGCGFMVGVGKPKLYTKFEVARLALFRGGGSL